MIYNSYYEVDCVCGEKVRLNGTSATCGKCGREIYVESWQVKHTLTAAGLLIEGREK